MFLEFEAISYADGMYVLVAVVVVLVGEDVGGRYFVLLADGVLGAGHGAYLVEMPTVANVVVELHGCEWFPREAFPVDCELQA